MISSTIKREHQAPIGQIYIISLSIPDGTLSWMVVNITFDVCEKSVDRETFKTICSIMFFIMRSFNDWWKTVPENLRNKTRKGDEGNKPLLNQINYVLLHLHLAGKHDAKPSHEELKDWLHNGQVDVLRMTAK